MLKTLRTLLSQDKEAYRVPRKVQDLIPVKRILKDGIFLVGNKYTKCFCFTDINYMVAGLSEKEKMNETYRGLLNSLDDGITTKITINNRPVPSTRPLLKRLSLCLCERIIGTPIVRSIITCFWKRALGPTVSCRKNM